MTLIPLADLTAADWFLADQAPLTLRSTLGPSGFDAYARVLHAEQNPGDAERDEGHLRDSLLRALCDVLARHTTTPDACFFGLWEGYGDIHGGDAVGFLTTFSGPPRWPGRIFTQEKPPPPVPPAFPPHVMDGPLLGDQFLFAGRLAEAGHWGAAPYGQGVPRDINSPNLMWPTDHAWFVTTNIEGTWTGVAGSDALLTELLAEPRLEVVRTRYDEAAL
ncbi:hypothetical protein C6I20_02290 [Aeromicrobium sp. A1-2]|uniref:hypothetical protein n=1 Tax=Aeromicrobium sp. A1-2 TaxID=2107713 RepID=UPI000E53E581|nr:hypothetical protein [Aeromicrobium sp. A1-2]AXT84138.1 hypothetical protein C6I20_02290 [Aeromicrobium sp. A1-2]